MCFLSFVSTLHSFNCYRNGLGRGIIKRQSYLFNVHCSAETQRMSKAIPFFPKPERLDESMPGYAGFDPLGFSDKFDVKFLQEAEIKHCRICMLAALGWVFPEFWHLPSEVFSNTSPLAALGQVPKFGLIQILLLVVALEAISLDKLEFHPEKEPGDFGFDPLGLGKGKSKKWMQTAEIKNGRLAMIAMGAFFHQNLLTNQGVIEQLKSHNFIPTTFPLH
jgi:light-harvesting complex I chlorophyll a/b binding protein 4